MGLDLHLGNLSLSSFPVLRKEGKGGGWEYAIRSYFMIFKKFYKKNNHFCGRNYVTRTFSSKNLRIMFIIRKKSWSFLENHIRLSLKWLQNSKKKTFL